MDMAVSNTNVSFNAARFSVRLLKPDGVDPLITWLVFPANKKVPLVKLQIPLLLRFPVIVSV